MDPHHHSHHDHVGSGGNAAEASRAGSAASLNRVAFSATVHCLTGCAIGEVLGMVIGTALGLSNVATIVLAVVLAFIFGYALTMLPLLRTGLAFGSAGPRPRRRHDLDRHHGDDRQPDHVGDPGRNGRPAFLTLSSPLFWGSLAAALLIAGAFAFPVNRWLISRGRGHAVVHSHHSGL